MTTYSILQYVVSPYTDERINLGILLSDGERTEWRVSDKRLDVLKLLRGTVAYNLVKRISDGLSANEQLRRDIMQPSQLAYLRRYANNLITVSESSQTNLPLDARLTNQLYSQMVDGEVRHESGA